MALSSSDLKNGTVYKENGETFKVIKYEHIKRGRQPAVYKVKVKNILNGAISIKSYKDADKFEEAELVRRSAQYVYKEGTKYNFMYNDDFDQFSLDEKDIEWEHQFLCEGQKVIAIILDDKVISIELPKTVDLKVVSTMPAVAGNTATGATKNGELESGLEISIPLFIKEGEILVVNTDNGEYVSRASE